jgi:hypothetical protein
MFNRMRAYRVAGGGGVLAIAVALGLAGAGQGAGPNVTQAPTITGTLTVGQTLTATNGRWSGPPGTEAGYTWLRCTDDAYNHCSVLDNTNSANYKLTGSDLNKKMRVALWASKDNQYDYMVSDPTTAYITAPGSAATPTPTPPPPPPAATPVPTPTPTPPVPAPAPAFDVTAQPVATPVPNSGAVLHQTATSKRVKMFKPAPLVRIRGRLTAAGAHVSMLTVRAPKGASISISCSGSGCPGKLTRSGGGVRRLARFERDWRSGTRLQVMVTRTGYVGKVTVITIRRGAAPARSDRCLYPGHKRTQRCPS